MMNEKINAAIAAGSIMVSAWGATEMFPNAGAIYDHEKWEEQKSELKIKMSENVPVALSQASAEDQERIDQIRKSIEELDQMLINDSRSERSEGIGATAFLGGAFTAAVVGISVLANSINPYRNQRLEEQLESVELSKR